MDLGKKVLQSELSFSWEGTCSRPYVYITKSLKLKYLSRSSLPQMLLSNKAVQKTQRKKSAQGPARVPGPGFPVFLGSRQGPTRVTGPAFPVFIGSRQDSARALGPGFLQGLARIPLGSQVPVFRFSRVPPAFHQVPWSRCSGMPFLTFAKCNQLHLTNDNTKYSRMSL